MSVLHPFASVPQYDARCRFHRPVVDLGHPVEAGVGIQRDDPLFGYRPVADPVRSVGQFERDPDRAVVQNPGFDEIVSEPDRIVQVRSHRSGAERPAYFVAVEPFSVVGVVIAVFIPFIHDQVARAFLPDVDPVADLAGCLQGRTVHTETDQVVFPGEIVHSFRHQSPEYLRCRRSRTTFADLVFFRSVADQRYLENQALRRFFAERHGLARQRIPVGRQYHDFLRRDARQRGFDFCPGNFHRFVNSFQTGRIRYLDDQFPRARRPCQRARCDSQ